MHSTANSTCFLCLLEIVCGDTPHNEKGTESLPAPTLEKINLKSIFRYLGINFKNVYAGFGEKHARTRLLEDIGSNFFVALCQNCSKIVEPLSALFMELELLQMKVDYFLTSVCGVLKHSETDEEPPAQFERLITTAEMSKIHQQFDNLLRREIKRKCEIKLNQVTPKVKLIKTREPLAQPDHWTTTFSTEMRANKNATVSAPSSPTSGDSEGDASDALDSPLTECVPESETKSESKYRPCSLCDPPLMVIACMQRRHESLYHVETWLISSKLEHVTMDQFKKYCEHVVKVEVLSTSKVHVANTACQSKYKCGNCSFVARDASILRHHICTKHKTLIAKKLVRLQRTTTVDKLEMLPLPEKAVGRMRPGRRVWKCNVCSLTFPSAQSLAKHKTLKHGKVCDVCNKSFAHSLILLNHKKVEHEGVAYQPTCDMCGSTFKYLRNLVKHYKMKHENAGDDNLNKAAKYMPCRQCDPPKMVQTEHRKRHTILYHLETWLLPSKLEHLTVEEFKMYCDHVVKVELLSSAKLFVGSGPPPTNEKCWKCPHCSFVGKKFKLRHHVFGMHKDIISRKLEQLQRSIPVGELEAQLPSSASSRGGP